MSRAKRVTFFEINHVLVKQEEDLRFSQLFYINKIQEQLQSGFDIPQKVGLLKQPPAFSDTFFRQWDEVLTSLSQDVRAGLKNAKDVDKVFRSLKNDLPCVSLPCLTFDKNLQADGKTCLMLTSLSKLKYEKYEMERDVIENIEDAIKNFKNQVFEKNTGVRVLRHA